MTKKERKPRGFWLSRREQLTADALTMTQRQMAAKYDATEVSIGACLRYMGIKTGSAYYCIEDLAKTMTANELAAHFGASVKNIYAALALRGIKSKPVKERTDLDACKDDIARLAPTMTASDLAAHLGVGRATLRHAMDRLGIERNTRQRQPEWGEDRKQQIKQMLAEGKHPSAIAEHYGIVESYLRNRMLRMGIKLSQIAPQPRKPRIASKAGRQKPVQRAAYMPKSPSAPVQIIIPENVKITIAQLDTAGMRLCNGTSTQAYSPALHGGVMRSYR